MPGEGMVRPGIDGASKARIETKVNMKCWSTGKHQFILIDFFLLVLIQGIHS